MSKEKNLGNQITNIISREFLTPLEETRLAIEEIVIAKNVAVDLFPRPNSIRKQQHELIYHYHLNGITVGKEKNKRLYLNFGHTFAHAIEMGDNTPTPPKSLSELLQWTHHGGPIQGGLAAEDAF